MKHITSNETLALIEAIKDLEKRFSKGIDIDEVIRKGELVLVSGEIESIVSEIKTILWLTE